MIDHRADALAYERSKNGSKVVVLANGGDNDYSLELEGKWIDMLTYETFENIVTVPPFKARIKKKI